MPHDFNWPQLVVLAALFLPATALWIYLAATFEKRVAERVERDRAEKQREREYWADQKYQAALTAEECGYKLCTRCQLRPATKTGSMCSWCGIFLVVRARKGMAHLREAARLMRWFDTDDMNPIRDDEVRAWLAADKALEAAAEQGNAQQKTEGDDNADDQA